MQTVKVRENMQTVQSPGKYANGTKPGKICKRCKAQKTCKRCKAQENMQTVQSAGRQEETNVIPMLLTIYQLFRGNYGCEIHGTTFFGPKKFRIEKNKLKGG